MAGENTGLPMNHRKNVTVKTYSDRKTLSKVDFRIANR